MTAKLRLHGGDTATQHQRCENTVEPGADAAHPAAWGTERKPRGRRAEINKGHETCRDDQKLGGGTLALKIHVADEDYDEQVEMRRPRYGIVGDIDSDGIPADEQDTGALSQNESEGKVAHQASQPARHDRNPRMSRLSAMPHLSVRMKTRTSQSPAPRPSVLQLDTGEEDAANIPLGLLFSERHADPWLLTTGRARSLMQKPNGS